jgi:hypothetical protein
MDSKTSATDSSKSSGIRFPIKRTLIKPVTGTVWCQMEILFQDMMCLIWHVIKVMDGSEFWLFL